MPALRYCLPFAFLALVPLGAALGAGWGGAWAFAPLLATPLSLVLLDAALGDAARTPARSGPVGRRWLPWLYIPLQLAVIVWAAGVVGRPGVDPVLAAGLTLSTGLTTGVFGFLAAHEMIHSRRPSERALGLALLASVFYMHFRISHLYGHHRRAATLGDPASARLGESLYAFFVRSVAGQWREAWRFETQRLRRAGRPVTSPRNRMLVYPVIEGLLALAVGLISWRALVFVLANAAIAILLLESFNYIAHYGLTRAAGPDGRLEPMGPRHSWNSERRMNNWSLFNMGRHSDHHRFSARPYERLETLPESAALPAGYAGAILLALVPPLWRRVMDPRVHRAARPPAPAASPSA
jgi:alkane 1-monooxygenase